MMSSVQDNPTAPLLWVAVILITLVVAVVTYFVSQRKVRTTLFFTGLTLLVFVTAITTQYLSAYLSTHFLGSFDKLGVPYTEVAPGWSLMIHTWPIWIVPVTVLLLLMYFAMGYWWRRRTIKDRKLHEHQQPEQHEKFTSQHVTHHLEISELKRELQEAKEKLAVAVTNQIAEVNKNAALQLLINKAEDQHEQLISKLQGEIQMLTADAENQNQEYILALQTIQQKENEVEAFKLMLKDLLEDKDSK